MSEITDAAALLDYPLGSTFTGRQGDVWMIDTHHRHGSQTYLIGPETGSMEASVLLQKWGPLTPQWRPDRPTQPTVQPSVETLALVVHQGWQGHKCTCGLGDLGPVERDTVTRVAGAVLDAIRAGER